MLSDDIKLKWRECLIRDKNFLKTLYCSNSLSNKNSLGLATEDEISTLLKVLFSIVKGDIPIKRIHYDTLIKSKKARLLHSKLSTFTKLKKVTNIYKFILYYYLRFYIGAMFLLVCFGS